MAVEVEENIEVGWGERLGRVVYDGGRRGRCMMTYELYQDRDTPFFFSISVRHSGRMSFGCIDCSAISYIVKSRLCKNSQGPFTASTVN